MVSQSDEIPGRGEEDTEVTQYQELRGPHKVAGARQTRRVLNQGRAKRLFLAADADPRVLEPVARLAGELGVRAQIVPTRKQLGEICGIPVRCAVAASLKED